MIYTKDNLETDINGIQRTLRDIRDKKGHDYACDTDCLENVRMCGEYGIIVRCFDKLMRLKNIHNKGQAMVKDESVQDTWLDLVNYALYGYILHGQVEKKASPRSEASFGGLEIK